MVSPLVDPAELASWRFDDTRSLGNALPVRHQDG